MFRTILLSERATRWCHKQPNNASTTRSNSSKQIVQRACVQKSSTSASGVLQMKFSLPYHCHFGQQLLLVGSHHALGLWDVLKGVSMQWSEGDVWHADLEVDSTMYGTIWNGCFLVAARKCSVSRISMEIAVHSIADGMLAKTLHCLQHSREPAGVQVCCPRTGWCYSGLEARTQLLHSSTRMSITFTSTRLEYWRRVGWSIQACAGDFIGHQIACMLSTDYSRSRHRTQSKGTRCFPALG